MTTTMNRRSPIAPENAHGFVVLSIHHLRMEAVQDRFVLFGWEYVPDALEPLPRTPVLRRRTLESAQRFCQDYGFIRLERNQSDPLNTVEYWVQPDVHSIIDTWT